MAKQQKEDHKQLKIGANVLYASLPIPEPFIPLIAETVVLWGNLDDHIERFRGALSVQKKCKNIEECSSSRFARRLNHLEALCDTYFGDCVPLLTFNRYTFSQLRIQKTERDLIVHGRYGFEDIPGSALLGLRLEDQPGGQKRARVYSIEKFRELVRGIAFMLARVRVITSPPPGVLDNWWIAWGISRRRISQLETALGPIRDHCLRTSRELSEQALKEASSPFPPKEDDRNTRNQVHD